MVMLMSLPTLGQTAQHITSDPEFPPTEEQPTSPPKIYDDGAFQDLVGDASECCAKGLHAINSAESDCRVDIPQASDNPTEDTVAPQSSQLKDNEKTIMGQFATATIT